MSEPLLKKAVDFANARNWQAADDTCREMLRRNSGNHAAMNLLGVVLAEKFEYESAENYARKAVRLKPDDPVYYSNLGLILKEQEKWDASFEAFSKACELAPQDYQSIYNLGTVYQTLKNDEQARECYYKAISINPDHVLSLSSLCDLLSRQKERREELYDIMQRMETALSKPDIQPKENLCFMLARTHDRLGNYDKAFKYLDIANSMVRKRFHFDSLSEKKRFESIKKVFTPGLLTEKAGNGSGDKSPIFIVGMPRSGTTLVEQILASHSQVAAGGELRFLSTVIMRSPHLTDPSRGGTNRIITYAHIGEISAPELKRLADAYLDATAHLRKEEKHFTDKMPQNFVNIGMIKLLFPNSRIIHCRRNPLDNGLSLYMHNFKNIHPYMYSLEEIGKYYIYYHSLMDYWRKLLPGFIYDIKYEELVNDPEAEVKKLLSYCGLDWEKTCLEFYKHKRIVKTASVAQVDRPLYTSSIGRWKNYEEHLRPLREILREGGIVP